MSLLCDFYALNMMSNLISLKRDKEICVFDYFFRKAPFNSPYVIFSGLNSVIEFVSNLKFSDDELDFLSTKFDKNFINYLKDFKFSGDIYSVKEGSVIFANEPVIRVKAPITQCLFIEGALLMYINYQSLISTKARRIRNICGDDFLCEFGLRRSSGEDASIQGSRSSIIGGFNGTSNVLAAKEYNIPAIGTMSHSWVLSFDNELNAFFEFAKCNKSNLVLLIDTYDTLNQGIKNAIEVFKDLRSKNILPKIYGVRIDSGDLAYLSKEIRKILDDNGFFDGLVFASNDLDERIIFDLKNQGAKINAWGVGTKLLHPEENLGGVYKMAGIFCGDEFIPKIKISENESKISLPHIKNIFRIIDTKTNKFIGDIIGLDDENFDNIKEFYDPAHPWKRTILNNFTIKKLLHPVIKDGKICDKLLSIDEISKFSDDEVKMLWDEFHRLKNPPIPKINLSQKLYDLKQGMLLSARDQ